MSSETPASARLPSELPSLALLGLTSPADEQWTQLRGLQFASLAKAAVARTITHVVAAMAVVFLFRNTVHVLALCSWIMALAGSLYLGVRRDALLVDADRRRISRDEVNAQSIGAILLALVWVLPVAVFSIYVDGETRLKLWTIMALLMTTLAIVLPAVPLTTLLFTAITCGAAVVNFVFMGMFDMAVLSVIFAAIIVTGTVASARHYLATRLAEASMAEKNEVVSLLLREFEENEADWLWEVDQSRRVRGVSPRFAFALGMEPAKIEGTPFLQLIAGPAWETGQFPTSLHDLAERMKRRESFSNLLVRVIISGEARWWELSGTPKIDENGIFDGFRGVGSDVTEQRESSEKIAHLARYDTLTGLPNRMMLTESMADAMRYAQQWRTRCAFLMIDLDRFKAVNDTLGHQVGDQLLARVSARLRDQMGEHEVCGRLGGDEFAVVIRDARGPEHVNDVARRIIENLSRPYEIDHHSLFIGASVGSAVGPKDGQSVEILMRNADLALYRSKDEGGGVHFVYEPSLHAHAEERRKLEGSLRRALERDEFVLEYQPVVDAGSGDILSFEALIRWHSQEHGVVSPGKFIPLAEDSRLIVPIGEWVLQTACREAARWPAHVKVAVNVSGEQLLDANFGASVIGALSSSGLAAHRLEIEVTESIFVRDAAQARAALERVMALGCGVALDDFGTGYSSLAYIRNLRFSTIKIDRSFVQGAAAHSRESLAIIKAVVAMAESLEMSTTAEGVETETELEVVRALGCRKIQGFYFGRPMPVSEIPALFSSGSRMRPLTLR